MIGTLTGRHPPPSSSLRPSASPSPSSPPPDNRGIIPRLVEDIFNAIDDSDEWMQFTIKTSYVEIYQEKVKDLINPVKENLKIRESPASGVWLEDVSELYVA